MTRWVLEQVGTMGPIEVFSDLLESLNNERPSFVPEDAWREIEDGESMILGQPGKAITVADALEFLDTLETYASNPLFQDDRGTKTFAGIRECADQWSEFERRFCFVWSYES